MIDFRLFDEYVERNADRFLADLIALCRHPSVSKTGDGIQETALSVVESFKNVDAQVEVLNPGEPYPVVLATLGAGRTSLLLYDHYDVQPAEPLDLWRSPPFEPESREGCLYGRGVGDDKGELVARLQALESYRQVFGDLPVQVKFLVEGAHEIGSPGLGAVVEANRGRLRADACLSEGLGRDEAGHFTIFLGCRGFAHVELVSQMREAVLASMYGGLLPNPALRLLQALATLSDDRGDLVLDGLKDHAVPPTPADLALLERIPFDEDELRTQLGTSRFNGDRSGAELLRHYLLEPFATISALVAGDLSWGLVLPGRAVARLDIRLVPDLEPASTADLVRQHLRRRGFDDVEVSLLGGVPPDRCPAGAPIVAAATAAARDLTGVDPIVYPLMPAYSASRVFHESLGTPVLFAGAVTNVRSNLHGPNENIRVAEYFEYIKYIGRLIARLA